MPWPVLEGVMGAAEKAFIIKPMKDPKHSYVNIQWYPLEPFVDFIERLWTEVER